MSNEEVGICPSSHRPDDELPSGLLPFQQKLLEEIRSESLGFWIVAPGLGLNRVLREYILGAQAECRKTKKLVIVLMVERDGSVYKKVVGHMPNAPKLVNSEFTQETRVKFWKSWGVYFVTSRVFIVDILRRKVPLGRVGCIVLVMPHGYMIGDYSTEAFVLRLYVRYCYANSGGLMSIRGFCENPLHFFDSFSKISQVIQTLHMHPRHVKLWPRIRTGVKQVLDDKLPVIGLEISLPTRQAKIHELILSFINGCFKELKESLRGLSEFDGEEAKIDHIFFHSFFDRLKSTPIYHKMGRRARVLAKELDILQGLVAKLIDDDAVTFYEFLLQIQGDIFHEDGIWLDLDHGDQIRIAAQSRLYVKKKKKNCKKNDSTESPISLILEDNSKWNALLNILNEIRDICKSTSNLEQHPVLIFVNNESKMNDLTEYLRNPDKFLLKKFLNFLKSRLDEKTCNTQFNDHSDLKTILERENSLEDDSDDQKQKDNVKDSNDVQFDPKTPPSSQKPFDGHLSIEIHPSEKIDQVLSPNRTAHFVILYEPIISTLREMECYKASRPNQYIRLYYLLYDNSTEKKKFLFSIEKETKAFKNIIQQRATSSAHADVEQWLPHPIYSQPDFSSNNSADTNTNSNISKYTENSIENKLNFSSNNSSDVNTNSNISKYTGNSIENKLDFSSNNSADTNTNSNIFNYTENSIENKLNFSSNNSSDIDTNSNIPKYTENSIIMNKTVSLLESALEVNGMREVEGRRVESTIVVDVREFRSKLPAILDCKNVRIVPVTLSVGDYVLTPDICVERKAISDLNQSLASGRLFSQLEQLVRVYKCPILLIEYDKSEAFKSLDRLYNFKIKIAKLTIHFNTVRIFWCRSPYDTADLFIRLKEGLPQPSDKDYNKYQEDEWIGENLEEYEALDVLKRMPGINEHNWKKLVYPPSLKSSPTIQNENIDNVHHSPNVKGNNSTPSGLSSLNQLPNYSKSDLQSILGQNSGLELHNFIHNSHKIHSK